MRLIHTGQRIWNGIERAVNAVSVTNWSGIEVLDSEWTVVIWDWSDIGMGMTSWHHENGSWN